MVYLPKHNARRKDLSVGERLLYSTEPNFCDWKNILFLFDEILRLEEAFHVEHSSTSSKREYRSFRSFNQEDMVIIRQRGFNIV